ncbi:MAG TPA: winged helix-turn-helix domain-containing protein [Jatrophihabitantaceae bacterium]|nr:winged helix-turn-helix domain-containing protein [Jatrophihabitantaceae bacterium]
MAKRTEQLADELDPLGRPMATDAEARALASTLRMRILRICLGEARSNKEIAHVLGKDPATTLHHVRRLVDTGFLAAQPVRRGVRGSREIPYLATGKSWRIQTPSKDRVIIDAFIEEVSLVPAESVGTARVGLRLTDAEKAEFERRLTLLLDEYIQHAQDPTGKPWSVFFSIHPDPNRT